MHLLGRVLRDVHPFAVVARMNPLITRVICLQNRRSNISKEPYPNFLWTYFELTLGIRGESCLQEKQRAKRFHPSFDQP